MLGPKDTTSFRVLQPRRPALPPAPTVAESKNQVGPPLPYSPYGTHKRTKGDSTGARKLKLYMGGYSFWLVVINLKIKVKSALKRP